MAARRTIAGELYLANFFPGIIGWTNRRSNR